VASYGVGVGGHAMKYYVCKRCERNTRGRKFCKTCWQWQARRKKGIPPRKLIQGESIAVRLPKPIVAAIRHQAKAQGVYIADVVRKYMACIFGDFQ
jgi:hypothetical protein